MKLSFVVKVQLTKKSRLKMSVNQFASQTETALAGVLPEVVTGKVKAVRVYMVDFPIELTSSSFPFPPALTRAGAVSKQKSPGRPSPSDKLMNDHANNDKPG